MSSKNLQELLAANSPLKTGAQHPNVKSFREILYELGFGKTLNWEKDNASENYDANTALAVKEFAKRNGLDSDGSAMSVDLSLKLMERYALVPQLKALLVALQTGQSELLFQKEASFATAVALCLRALGFVQENAADALREFATLENFPFDGAKLNATLSKGLADCLLYYYGDDFVNANLYQKSSTGLTITVGKKTTVVTDSQKSVTFNNTKYGKYAGLSLVGNQTIANYIQTNRDFLRSLDISDSAINVILAVSENEGNLDAINSYDNSFMSFGIFQWTLGAAAAEGELPALLKKIKLGQPAAFWTYFGQFGLDVWEKTGTTYGYLTFKGNKIATPDFKEVFRRPSWAFRFWDAGQDDRVKGVQIEHALSRLKNFYFKTDSANTIYGFPLSKIITSEYGVGLILDNHVNRPGYVRTCIKKAMDAKDLKNPTSWTSAEERKVLEAYLDIRVTHGDSPMTSARHRENVTKKYLAQHVISDERHSFRYTISGTRGASDNTPPDYNEADYPDIEHQEMDH